jgi:ACS family hexuronate transporter-like MFS transporter
VLTGALGFVWLFVWMKLYRSPETHPSLSEEERTFLSSDEVVDEGTAKVPWTSLLRYKQIWAFLLGKGLTDPIWYFYLFWLPTYLNKERGLSATKPMLQLLFPYFAADVGSVVGGWLSSYWITRGWPLARARYTAMAIVAFCMPGAVWAVLTKDFYVALGLISLATASHQAWSANIFTLASDMFPKRVVASVVGLGGLAGALGGMFMTLLTGGILSVTHTYVPLFVIAGLMHPLALFLVMGFAGGKLERADVDSSANASHSPTLLAAGTAVFVGGVALATLVLRHWSFLTTKSVSPAWQGLTGATGVALLGLALVYASRGRRALARQAP